MINRVLPPSQKPEYKSACVMTLHEAMLSQQDFLRLLQVEGPDSSIAAKLSKLMEGFPSCFVVGEVGFANSVLRD